MGCSRTRACLPDRLRRMGAGLTFDDDATICDMKLIHLFGVECAAHLEHFEVAFALCCAADEVEDDDGI